MYQYRSRAFHPRDRHHRRWSTKLNNAIRVENESKGDTRLVTRREKIYLEYRKRYVRIREDIAVREKLRDMPEGAAEAWREADRLERDEGKMPQAGQEKGAKFPTSKAHISVVFHSFWLIFGRGIISRNGLDRERLSLERARAERPR